MAGRPLGRRRFLEVAGGAALLGGIYGLGWIDPYAPARLRLRPAVKPRSADLAAVEGDPATYGDITERAINELGGMEAFVRPGDHVVLSPNMGWIRTPEQAAATHPAVLRRVIELCQRAGAGRITAVDYALDDPALAFEACGARTAIAGTTATLLSPAREDLYRAVDVPAAVPTRSGGQPYRAVHQSSKVAQMLPRILLQADVFISLPIIKDHEAAVMTGAMKKVMGVIWNRKDYHRYGLHPCIAEVNCLVRPNLIVADATRVLQTRGPKGPGEVTTPHRVIAGVDPVAVDAYSTQLLTLKGVTPDMVPHLILGEQLGVGTMALGNLRVREIDGAKGA